MCLNLASSENSDEMKKQQHNFIKNGAFIIVWTFCSKKKKIWRGRKKILAVTGDFQQCDILTWIHSDEPVCCCSLILNLETSNAVQSVAYQSVVIEYSREEQRLWSDCTHAQAGLSLCWLHIPYCWKSHILANFYLDKI